MNTTTLLFKSGDRVTVTTWGGQKGTVVQTNPLSILLDGRLRPFRPVAKDIKAGIIKIS